MSETEKTNDRVSQIFHLETCSFYEELSRSISSKVENTLTSITHLADLHMEKVSNRILEKVESL